MGTEQDRMRKDMATYASSAGPLRRRLGALAVFLPHFERPDFEFGRMAAPADGGAPRHDLSRVARDFLEYCYDNGWVQGFNWGEWASTPEAANLRDNPDAVADATPMQISKLITALVRQDRITGGSLDSAYQSGLVTGIVRRASVLVKDLPEENDETDWVTWWGLDQAARQKADSQPQG